MLARREMENPNFSVAQECSNDHAPSKQSTSLFLKGTELHRMLYWLQCALIFHIATAHSHGYSKPLYFVDLTLVKIVQ